VVHHLVSARGGVGGDCAGTHVPPRVARAACSHTCACRLCAAAAC
jgi:hypothetical protein